MTRKFTPFTMSTAFSRYGIRGLVIVCLLLSTSWAACADEPRVVMNGDFTADSELIIGSDLYVGLVLAKPGTVYNVQLFDEGDDLVAEFLGLESDRNGNIREELLWTRTGVTGCNCTPRDPAIYSFENFADAEESLDGREFRIRVFEGDIANQDQVTETDLPMVAKTPVRVYPSNASACLRTGFGSNEPTFVTVTHDDLAPKLAMLFVVPYQLSWTTGDPLNDVQPTGPKFYWVAPGAVPVAEALWLMPTNGEYQVILRWGFNTAPLFDETTDLVSKPMCIGVGGTYPECLVCPPPK